MAENFNAGPWVPSVKCCVHYVIARSPLFPTYSYTEHVDKWKLKDGNSSTLLGYTVAREPKATKVFMFDKERKMALGSRLVQRKVVAIGLRWSERAY